MEKTPFSTVNEMNKASHEIHLAAWKRLEAGRTFKELLETERFSYAKEELHRGISCKYGPNQDELVRVYSEGVGIQIAINPNMANEVEKSESYIESVIRATAEPFAKSYYQMKGLSPGDAIESVDAALKGRK